MYPKKIPKRELLDLMKKEYRFLFLNEMSIFIKRKKSTINEIMNIKQEIRDIKNHNYSDDLDNFLKRTLKFPMWIKGVAAVLFFCVICVQSNDLKLEGSAILEECLPNCSGVILTGVDISDYDLSGVNFNGAKLMGVDLSNAGLFEASFRNAYLMGVDLSEADLEATDFTKATLSGVDLEKADLFRANLRNIQLEHIQLDEANLAETNLSGVDMSSSVVLGANFTKATYNSRTIWPADVDPSKVGAILKE